MGRLRSPKDRRDNMLATRLSDEEHAIVKQMAKDAGCRTVGEFARGRLLAEKGPVEAMLAEILERVRALEVKRGS